MKTTRHSLMAKGILVLLSLLILVFVFTYSWYLPPDYPATASGMNLTTSADVDFDIAIGFYSPEEGYRYIVSDWITNGAVDFTRIPKTVAGVKKEYNLLNQDFYKPIDLTSNGVTFVRPAMLSKNRGIDTSKDTYEYAVKNQNYICFDLILRTDAIDTQVSLDEGSAVFGAIEGDSANNSQLLLSSYTGSAEFNKSEYGGFSEDSVVGAVRMSFVDYDSSMDTYEEVYGEYIGVSSSPRLMWIPRPDIYLLPNLSDATAWTLLTDSDSHWAEDEEESPNPDYLLTDLTGAPGKSYKQISSTHYYYQIFTTGSKTYATIPATCGTITSTTTDTDICDLTIPQGGYYYGKTQVNLWIDGCDAEARRAVDGGKFKMRFKLTAN